MEYPGRPAIVGMNIDFLLSLVLCFWIQFNHRTGFANVQAGVKVFRSTFIKFHYSITRIDAVYVIPYISKRDI